MSHAASGMRGAGGTGDRRSGDRPNAAVVTSHDDGIALLEVTGSFPEAAEAANFALRRALFHDPPVVVCDLSAVTGQLDEGTLEQLIDTGGLLEHWPGARLALVRDDDRLRGLLTGSWAADLLVETTVSVALLGLSADTDGRTARIHLDPQPLASRAARDFVTRTCLDWQRPHGISAAVLVVSELVTNGLTHAGTPMEVTLSAVTSRLRLTVYDGNDAPPRLLRSGAERRKGRGMHVVEGFSRAWGSLPGPDGGKAVWVVLDA